MCSLLSVSSISFTTPETFESISLFSIVTSLPLASQATFFFTHFTAPFATHPISNYPHLRPQTIGIEPSHQCYFEFSAFDYSGFSKTPCSTEVILPTYIKWQKKLPEDRQTPVLQVPSPPLHPPTILASSPTNMPCFSMKCLAPRYTPIITSDHNRFLHPQKPRNITIK